MKFKANFFLSSDDDCVLPDLVQFGLRAHEHCPETAPR